MQSVTIKDQAVKRIRNYYPWVFADEVANQPDRAFPGEVVAVLAPDGDFLGTAFYHPHARVALRLLSRRVVLPDRQFWHLRLSQALARREPLRQVTDALRLVYAEGDYLPGLVVDSYAGHLVIQFRCAGMEVLRHVLIDLLIELLQPRSIFERSDVPTRGEENLPEEVGQLVGRTPERVQIRENELRFWVDIPGGQKTGFFIDQRDARRHFGAICGPEMRVLDAFSYSGGFGLAGAAAGAQTTAVDKDPAALALAVDNARLNGLEPRLNTVAADLFRWLPEAAARGEVFHRISLDPPALIKSKAERSKGRGLLMDLVRPCLELLPPGGMLHLTTCAYHLTGDLAREAVRIAAEQTGRRLLSVAETIQGADHPYSIQMPETLYLRGCTYQVAED